MPYESPTLRKLIQTTLSPMTLWTANAAELLLATCAQESDFGLFRHQIHGPAVGIFQMEPEDYNDIWTNYLAYHSYWANQIRALSTTNTVDDMKTNDPYAIAMARIHYMRKPGALPAPTDLNGLWNYYKINYNSRSGAATQTEFYANYKRWVVDGIAV